MSMSADGYNFPILPAEVRAQGATGLPGRTIASGRVDVILRQPYPVWALSCSIAVAAAMRTHQKQFASYGSSSCLGSDCFGAHKVLVYCEEQISMSAGIRELPTSARPQSLQASAYRRAARWL